MKCFMPYFSLNFFNNIIYIFKFQFLWYLYLITCPVHVPFFCSVCCRLSLLSRVINAGKSTLNEDQACCEVLVLKRRPAGSSAPNRTPMTRRRSSLPNGEGLGLRECLVSPINGSGSVRKYLPFPCVQLEWHSADTFYEHRKDKLRMNKMQLQWDLLPP